MKRTSVVMTSSMFLLLSIAVILSNCGGGGGGGNNTNTNPVPAISSISPTSATTGGASFTLTVNGSNFVNGASTVRWNGSDRATTFTSATQLTAAILASDIATAGTAQVTVLNSSPGGGTSNAMTFTIGTPTPPIVGTWFGTLEDGSGSLFTLQVTVNANNTVTNEKVNGSATGVTHTISLVSGQTQIYATAGSDGTSGGLFADSAGTHIVFTDDAANFAVMQKGATSLPTFVEADFVATWSGYTVELNASGGIDTYNSTATVQASGAFSGSNKYGAFSGSFLYFDGAYGGVWGDITSPASGYVGAFMTADKAFIGAYSCPSSGTWDQCEWSAWHK